MNQCMGCQAGWPLNPRGSHVVIGGYPGEIVACTKDRYMTHYVEIRPARARWTIHGIGLTGDPAWVSLTTLPMSKADADNLVRLVSVHWEARVIEASTDHQVELARVDIFGCFNECRRWRPVDIAHHPDCIHRRDALLKNGKWDVSDANGVLTGMQWVNLRNVQKGLGAARKRITALGLDKTLSIRQMPVRAHLGVCDGCSATTTAASVQIQLTQVEVESEVPRVGTSRTMVREYAL